MFKKTYINDPEMDMKFKFKRKIFEIKPLAISRINLEYVKKTSILI